MNARTARILIVLAAVIAALLLVVVVTMLGGGSGGGEAATTSSVDVGTSTTGGGTTTTEDPSGTSQPATTTTASPTTTSTTAADPCAGMPSATTPALDGAGVSWVFGDFDGVGGALDRLIAYEEAGVWFVQVALENGYATEVAVEGPAFAYGAREFGGVPEQVGFASTFAGASTEFVGFFHLAECELRPAGLDGGGQAVFGVGGSVTHQDGIRCTADGLEITSATTDDGTTWEYISATLHWVPGFGEFQTVASSAVLLTSPADDATIFSAGDFDCFG